MKLFDLISADDLEDYLPSHPTKRVKFQPITTPDTSKG
jgi:hypothetical protein